MSYVGGRMVDVGSGRKSKPGAVAGLDLLNYFLDHIVTTVSIYSLIINFRNTSS